MVNISPSELALELLNHCLRGKTWPGDLVDALAAAATHPDSDRAREGTKALFGIVVERLADLFEPELCDVYAQMFSDVIAYVLPEFDASELVARYGRVRAVRPFRGRDPKHIYVLSRVTLGADVAVTSVVLDAVKRRFPEAAIHLVGPRKNWELFERDARVRHVPLTYTRADTLYYRLAAGRRLHSLIPPEDSIVVDPDSRLTQLGLLPVCPEEFYYFFESRAYGHESDRGLTGLTAQWLAETFDIEEAKPYVAPAQEIDTGDRAVTAVSLGVGENQSKRIPDPFERDLIGGLVGNDGVVLVDRGAGGEESARVARAVAESGARADQVMLWDGSFAAFASAISRSRMYVGYDSAGQHVAAACGTPLVVVFTGFASERMFHRWRPSGEGQVIRVDTPDPAKVLVDTLSAVYRLT